jgi:hypothetical protein
MSPSNEQQPSELDTRLCRHCGRAANRHGKYLGGCMKDGKAMKTTFEPALDKPTRLV